MVLGHRGYKQFVQGSVKRPSLSRIRTNAARTYVAMVTTLHLKELRIITLRDQICFCNRRRLRVFQGILFSMKLHHILKLFTVVEKKSKGWDEQHGR